MASALLTQHDRLLADGHTSPQAVRKLARELRVDEGTIRGTEAHNGPPSNVGKWKPRRLRESA